MSAHAELSARPVRAWRSRPRFRFLAVRAEHSMISSLGSLRGAGHPESQGRRLRHFAVRLPPQRSSVAEALRFARPVWLLLRPMNVRDGPWLAASNPVWISLHAFSSLASTRPPSGDSSENFAARFILDREISREPVKRPNLILFEKGSPIPNVALIDHLQCLVRLIGEQTGVMLHHLQAANLTAVEQRKANAVMHPVMPD